MTERRKLSEFAVAVLLNMAVGVLALTGCGQRNREEAYSAELFYGNPCSVCEDGVKFEDAIRQALKEHGVEISLTCKTYNVFRVEERNYMEERGKEQGVEVGVSEVPAAYIDGTWYRGSYKEIGEQVAADLAGKEAERDGFFKIEKAVEPVEPQEYSTVSGEMETRAIGEEDLVEMLDELGIESEKATVIYFYRVDCSECNDVKPFIDDLPQTINVDGRETELHVIYLNSREGNNGELIRALFKIYQVPSEEQMVPFVFLADSYLAGQEKIVDNLLELLEQGHGQGFSFLEDFD